MASLDISGIPEVLAEMRKLGEDTGPVAQAMLDAGAAVAVESWKETCTRFGLVKTGAMRDSIGVTTKSAGMLYREITAIGKDARGVRNGAKAFMLHYGTSRFTATYWWDRAEQEAEPKVNAAMKAVWDHYRQTGEINSGGASTGNG